jgi:uncharacterized membrane protein
VSVAANKRTRNAHDTHPALMRHAQERAKSIENRIADAITAYAGSMRFVYLSAILFAVWMLVIEKKPWPTLTLVVSLEAIFLSTFVMISQNRADEKRNVMALAEWKSVQLEESQNEELLRLSNQILELTDAIHRLTIQHTGGAPGGAAGGPVGQVADQGPSSGHVADAQRPEDS